MRQNAKNDAVTVKALTEEFGLELLSGADRAHSPIRWAHLSELTDPTPWLQGGEFLLTTGIGLARFDDSEWRAYIRRLSKHGLVGLGFGTGFNQDRVPEALLQEARATGFPVFEVPYRTPFIAITEWIFSRLVNHEHLFVERLAAARRKLERLILNGEDLNELTRAIAAAIGCTAIVFDTHGRQLTSRDFGARLSREVASNISAEIATRSSSGRHTPFIPNDDDLIGRALVLPVPAPSEKDPSAWLACVTERPGITYLERLLLHQSATILALSLLRDRVIRNAKQGVLCEMLKDVLFGDISTAEMRRQLEGFGITDTAVAVVFDASEESVETIEHVLGRLGAVVVAYHDGLVNALVGSLVEADDLVDVLDALASEGTKAWAALGRPVSPTSIRRSYYEARCALEASRDGKLDRPRVASSSNVDSIALLLSIQNHESLVAYCDRILEPIRSIDARLRDEMLRSLEAYIRENGSWQRAAQSANCHRHTLRYRIRRIEKLTGRDLSNIENRVQFWLALQARDLVD